MTGLIVVADTSPLRYLVVIECEHLLPALYGRVLIPLAVAVRTGWKSDNPHTCSNPQWTWTKANDKRLLLPKRLTPTFCWSMKGMPGSKRNEEICVSPERYA